MKCEKHNIDMYWKGDLRNGAMHCDQCEKVVVSASAYLIESLKALAESDDGGAIIKKNFPHGIPGTVPPPPMPNIARPMPRGTVDPYMFHDEVSFRRARVQAVHRALDQWRRGNGAVCEYCGQHDGPDHLNRRSCEDEFYADEKFLNSRGIRI